MILGSIVKFISHHKCIAQCSIKFALPPDILITWPVLPQSCWSRDPRFRHLIGWAWSAPKTRNVEFHSEFHNAIHVSRAKFKFRFLNWARETRENSINFRYRFRCAPNSANQIAGARGHVTKKSRVRCAIHVSRPKYKFPPYRKRTCIQIILLNFTILWFITERERARARAPSTATTRNVANVQLFNQIF